MNAPFVCPFTSTLRLSFHVPLVCPIDLAPLPLAPPLPLQNGVTPLHYASMIGHLETVRLLLDRGTNKEAKDSLVRMDVLGG